MNRLEGRRQSKKIVLRPDGTANARAVLNAQLDAWRKENDDDHEYRGNSHNSGSRSMHVLYLYMLMCVVRNPAVP